MKNHNYSAGGKYFITICTHPGQSYFGHILNGKMILSESGHIANKYWHEIPEHFSFISLDEFVVMPDHVHGIIIIQSASHVETLHATSLQPAKNEFMSSISPKHGSLATVIRSYKSAVSKNLRSIIPGFSWQPRYYDHLIRSNGELNRIRKYIIDNPTNWEQST